jgi:NADP-dependent 3-hydroxy acid dehydrogenase YdfG
LDTSDTEKVKSFVSELKEGHGVKHVDVLINNAGVYGKARHYALTSDQHSKHRA